MRHWVPSTRMDITVQDVYMARSLTLTRPLRSATQSQAGCARAGTGDRPLTCHCLAWRRRQSLSLSVWIAFDLCGSVLS